MNKAPVILLVDQDPEKLHSLNFGEVEVFSVGKELSRYLVTEMEADRSQAAIQWLEATLRQKAPGPVICTDTALLFEPSLKLDPLALLKRIGRHTQMIVHWTGEYQNGTLSYAVPEHSHYRFWKNLEGIEIKGANDAL